MDYQIGNKLKQLRTNSSLSTSDVVMQLSVYGFNIKEKTLYGYESGKSMPNADIFLCLCKIYNITSFDIFFDVNTPKPNIDELQNGMFLYNLEQLMKKHNLNKHSFSQQSGIPYKTIDNFWKKGCDNVKLSTLKKISAFFDVTLDTLIFGENYKKKYDTIITKEEHELLSAYRSHPEMQQAINKMLDIPENNTIQEAIKQTISEEIDNAVKTSKHHV